MKDKTGRHIHRLLSIWDSDGPTWTCDVCGKDFYDRRRILAPMRFLDRHGLSEYYRRLLVFGFVVRVPRFMWRRRKARV